MPRNKSEKEIALATQREFEGKRISRADLNEAYKRMKDKAKSARRDMDDQARAIHPMLMGALSVWASQYAFGKGVENAKKSK